MFQSLKPQRGTESKEKGCRRETRTVLEANNGPSRTRERVHCASERLPRPHTPKRIDPDDRNSREEWIVLQKQTT